MRNTIELIAQDFGHRRELKTDRGMMTQCPCHDGENLALELWVTANGQIRMKCHDGCLTKDVREEVQKAEERIALQSRIGASIRPQQSNKNHLALSMDTMREMNFEAPVIYLEPIIRALTIMMIYAEPGVGKSWIVHNMALGLTRKNTEDVSIGPWTVTNGCGVLLVDGELPIVDLRNRLGLLAKSMGEENKNTPLTIWSSMHFEDNDEEGVNLATEKWRNRIIDHFIKHPECKVLIMDNQASLTTGLNENTKPAWDPINQWFLKLRTMGVAVILVHHSNKGGSDRGHSCKRDNLDTVIVLNVRCFCC